MKKICLVLIVTALVSLNMALVNAFPDVNSENWSWAKTSIEKMSDRGIIMGFPDGTFKPSEGVTRLQALILIARIMGVNEKENKDYVSLAEDVCEDTLLTYSIANKKEIAYLLYRGIINKDELYQYISPMNMNSVLKRYETAILLTKALGCENQVKDKLMTVLPYNDVLQIPLHAKPYVEYVRNENIMGGMTQSEFGPMEDVTRAQIAVMLDRTMNKIEEQQHIINGTVVQKDVSKKTITVRNPIDVEKSHKVDENVLLRLDGQNAELEEFLVGTSVKLTLISGELYMIEGITPDIDEIAEGIISFISSSTLNNRTRKMELSIDKDGETIVKEYTIDDAVIVTYDGRASNISNIYRYDYAKVDVKKGKIKKIVVESRIKTVEGIVEELILEPRLKIRVKLDKDEGIKEYEVLNDVRVTKNGAEASLKSIFPSDNVELTLEYNKVQKLKAESVKKKIDGTIEEIIISRSPSIKIKKDGDIKTYDLIRNADIRLNGKTVIDDKPVDIYDLRLGQHVELNLEGNMAVMIDAKHIDQAQQITGTVELVNESYGFINVAVLDGISGDISKRQVFIKNKAKIINSTSSRSTSLNIGDIKVGNIVTAIGTTDTGVFEANTVVIIN